MTYKKTNGASGSSTQWGANWAILTLPYTEDSGLAKMYNMTKPIVSTCERTPCCATKRPVFLCPSDAFYNSQALPAGLVKLRRGTELGTRQLCQQWLDHSACER